MLEKMFDLQNYFQRKNEKDPTQAGIDQRILENIFDYTGFSTKTFPSIIGPNDYQTYCGLPSEAPPLLSYEIQNILNSACPFWRGCKVHETHNLMFVPGTIDGKPFCFNLVQDIARDSRTNLSLQFSQFGGHLQRISREIGNCSSRKPYWCLITKKLVPGTRGNLYESCRYLVQEKSFFKKRYRLPTCLEMTTLCALHHAKTNERLFPEATDEDALNYSVCEERVLEDRPTLREAGGMSPVTVGGFAPDPKDPSSAVLTVMRGHHLVTACPFGTDYGAAAVLELT